jgi:hypothetical protein
MCRHSVTWPGSSTTGRATPRRQRSSSGQRFKSTTTTPTSYTWYVPTLSKIASQASVASSLLIYRVNVRLEVENALLVSCAAAARPHPFGVKGSPRPGRAHVQTVDAGESKPYRHVSMPQPINANADPAAIGPRSLYPCNFTHVPSRHMLSRVLC